MTSEAPSNITLLLNAWRNGDAAAEEKLFSEVFAELSRLARLHMVRENTGHTLQTGALVNEAYLRLVDAKNPAWENRTHFFRMCSRVMREVLVDHARRRRAQKRGGGGGRIPFEDVLFVSESDGELVLALDDAMRRLAKLHPRKSEIVEMRFFGGLTFEEIAQVLEVSRMTVNRDFRFARAWLHSCLQGEPPDAE
jgi:RNA polymerase sigma factor (TIGR02999 family)